MTRRRLIVWYASATIVGLAAWLAAAYWLVPPLIRSAYRGESIGPLNRIIGGQAENPVEHYLELWDGLILPATGALLLIAALGLVLILQRERLGGWVRAALHDGPSVSAGGAAWLGAACGVTLGLVDVVPPLVRQAMGRPEQFLLGREALWAGPVSGLFVGSLLGLSLWGLQRLIGSSSIRPLALVLLGLVFYTLIQALTTGIHPAASLLLGLGVAARLTALVSKRPGAAVRAGRRATVGATLGLALLAVGLFGEERLSESRIVSSLPAAPDGAPDVLLIILDTVRAKSLSLYGHDRPTTPRLDALSESATVFERAVATAPWTLPSHATMFTGRWHHELSADWRTPLGDRWPTLSETLSASGYRTGGFVGNLWYTPKGTGLERGFARYSDHPITPLEVLRSTWLGEGVYIAALRLAGRHPRSIKQREASSVSGEFLDWVGAGPDRPYFAFLNYADAHHPYYAPPPFDRAFSDPPPRWWLAEWGTTYESAELQELQDAYESSIAYLDDQLGRLFDELERRGRLDKTLVIVTSDHGEQFGEHDVAMHGNSLYMPVMRVPLLLRLPGAVPPGRRIHPVVSVRDIPATVLDLTGLEAELPGASLRRFWAGSPGPDLADDALLTRVSPNDDFAMDSDPASRGRMDGAVLGGLNLIRNGDGREELYDLMTDLDQLDDLVDSAAYAEALARLRDALPPGPETTPHASVGPPP